MIAIGQNLGRYRILEKIGAGGMGEVYLARDERLERPIAIKVLSAGLNSDESSRKRFRKEALTLSKLNHPNIATILDYDTQDGIDFLVMEHIVGSAVSEKLDHGPLQEKELVSLALQIAFALEEAHSRGIIHRDLKPNNLMVTPRGQVKVLDFGLAKLLQPASHDSVTKSAATGAHFVVGTLAYMSPEQLRSEPVDDRSDVYSFGVVLYEMSTGKRPHSQSQPISLADAVLHQMPAPPKQLRSDLSPLLQEIILKCLEKEPARRYQSMKELIVDLRRLETPSMSESPFMRPEVPRKAPLYFRKLALPVILFAVLLIAIFAGMKFSKKQNMEQPKKGSGANIESIVALPSKVYGLHENDFLADAIPNALSVYLSKVKGLETKVSPSSAEVEQLGGDLGKIGTLYGVQGLVSSSVTADAEHLVLNIQLLDAASRRVLWSDNYDGRRESYLDLVQTAANGLRAEIRPDQPPLQVGSTAKRSTEDEFAYQRGFYYLRSYYYHKRPEDFEHAQADLKHALELDPNNARAAASLSRLYMASVEAGAPLSEILPQLDHWAYRALQIDYRCGEAWQVLTIAEEMRANSDKRKRLEYGLKAATYASQSGYSHHVLAAALSRYSFELSVEAALLGTRREPLHLNGLLFAAGMLSRQDRPKEALKLIDQALSVQPGMPLAIIMKVWLLLRDHQVGAAEQLAGQLDKLVVERKLQPGWVDFAHEWLDFEKNLAAGDQQKASVALGRLVKEARGEAPPFFRWEVITGNILGIQAKHDSRDATLETLTIRSGKGILEPYDWLLLSPELEQVRNDSRFQQLLPRSRVEFQEMLSVFEEARKRNEFPSYLEKPLARLRGLP